MKNVCEGCEKRKCNCHDCCKKYQKAKFVHHMFKEIARKKKEEDLFLGVKAIDRHVRWEMMRARK